MGDKKANDKKPVSEELLEVENAADATVLFSSIEKRAKNKYRRLMRAVHPDIDPSDRAAKAASKLNSLWDEWTAIHNGGSASTSASGTSSPESVNRPSSHRTATVLKTSLSALILSDSWLSVARKPNVDVSLDGRAKAALTKAAVLAKGSPVYVPESSVNVSLAQADGSHIAVKSPIGILKDAWPLNAFSRLEGRDAAWIMKRILFLGGTLEESGLVVPDIGSGIVVRPSSHTLGLVNLAGATYVDPRGTSADKVFAQLPAMLKELVEHIDAATCDGRRLMRFAESCMLDSRPTVADLLTEFDDMLVDVYGGPSFHKMDDLQSHLA